MRVLGETLFREKGLGSMRARMLVVFSGMVLLASLTIAIYVGHQIKLEMMALQDRHAHNLLNTVLLNVESAYNSYSFQRDSLLEERKSDVSHISEIALHQVESFYQMVQDGRLGEAQAKQQAMDIVRRMRYDKGVGYVWIQDMETPVPRLLMHPTRPELDGRLGFDPLYYSALDTGQNLLEVFSEICRQEGQGFVKYRWPKPSDTEQDVIVTKVSHVRLFEPWGWIVGTGVYMDDIERDSQQRFETIMEDLRQTMSKVKIAQTGYMFIFDGQKRAVVHPYFAKQEIVAHKNPETGHFILDDLIEASKHPDQPFSYMWNSPLSENGEDFTHRKLAYMCQFKPLTWYIGASVYEDDIRAPALAMQRRILWITCGLVLGAMVLTALLATDLARPLSKLASAAREIKETGIGATEIPQSGPTETRELGRCLGDMVASIGNALREKENSLEAKQRSEEDLRITLDSIVDAVISTDRAGRIVRMNPVAETLTGWHLDEAKNRPLDEIFRTEDPLTREPVLNPVEHVLATSDASSAEEHAILLAREGNECTISIVATPIRSQDGEMRGVVLVFRDVTRELALRQQLQHSQKMDAIGQLAGGIAHDFNNMLGGILSAAELSNLQLPEDSKIKKNNQLIIDTARRAAGLTGQLLSFARRRPSITTQIGVHRLLEEVTLLLQNTIDRKTEFSMELKAKNDVIEGDPSQLQSIFMNLGINAAHAMENGGTIRITTSEIELDETYCSASDFEILPGSYLMVEVEDEGKGIAPKDLDHIFEPFFTTKGIGKGTGLGLAAVYGAVSQHKGEITVSSKVGVGSRFQVRLPFVLNGQAESIVSEAESELASGKGRVLVVDDEMVVRKTAKPMLEHLGYEVVLAENGKSGLEIFQQDPESFDLVLMDMIMPEMNGLDCFTAMKAIKPDVCVVFCSGFTHKEDLEQLKASGARDIISKPYGIATLSRIIRDALDEKHQAS